MQTEVKGGKKFQHSVDILYGIPHILISVIILVCFSRATAAAEELDKDRRLLPPRPSAAAADAVASGSVAVGGIRWMDGVFVFVALFLCFAPSRDEEKRRRRSSSLAQIRYKKVGCAVALRSARVWAPSEFSRHRFDNLSWRKKRVIFCWLIGATRERHLLLENGDPENSQRGFRDASAT